ncbi:DUF3306 domain-containing protein [Bosea psychrotolerans]|uniref:Uncharacterized protein DUF3306 n=1 Tax=Bosea psychrotolerans TaxID=1871628 RepID=A0A2S4M4E0_9HYPH|nr:DUF3306 domain-containing protein [Bosea psychrotolerans]POR49578.1 uncharacterized protein DUF3306 [Bosea psychrotolerans]
MSPRAGDLDEEGFLTRWSRRKRAAAEQAEVLPPSPVSEALPAEVEPQADAAQLEMVEPPSLDLIDKDFDVAHWLKQNVPESWKLAAMRRAWESDPTIRDFENPARDYALDWNTPGGAPGYGPLTESDDVEAMVRGIFGDAPEPGMALSDVDKSAGDSMSHALSSHDESRKSDAALQDEQPAATSAGSVRVSEAGANPVEEAETGRIAPDRVYAAAQNNPEPDMRSMRIRKRRGGAVPV